MVDSKNTHQLAQEGESLTHQHLFTRPSTLLFAIFFLTLSCSKALAATAQSTASVSWATAFSAFPAASSIYSAGEDLLVPNQSLSFSGNPTNAATQGLNYGDAATGASAIADAGSLFAESHATNGTAAVSASMFSILYFDEMESGLLSVTVPYTLSTLVQPGVGSSTVRLFASLTIFDFDGDTVEIAPETDPALDDTGLGLPNDLTGMLSLEFQYDGSEDQGAVLNIGVFAESTATTVETVPIPGGLALALPVLFPLFANRKKKSFLPPA